MKKISFLLVVVMLFSALSIVAPTAVVSAADSKYTVSDGAFANFSLHVGSDETERNFIWHSESNEGYVDFAVRDGDTFPSEYTSVQTRLSLFEGAYVHRATIFGLKNDTEYVYRLRSGSIVSSIKFFDTDSEDGFNFIFVGDPQMGAGSLSTNIDNWKKTLSTAMAMFPESSLLVSAGDQVEKAENRDFYAAFLAPEQLSTLAVATSIGNHDYDATLYKNYFNNPNTSIDGKTYGVSKAGSDYWYTYNNVLFMHINSCNISWDEHKEFMEKAIAANPHVGWKVVVTHYNFFGSNEYYINEQIKERREAFAPIMQELDIDVVLAGHEHVNSRAYMIDGLTPDTAQGNATSVTDPTGVLYMSGGSPSGSKYYTLLPDDQLPHIAFKLNNTITFTNVEVDEDSFKITTYRVSDRKVMDTFEIKKDKNKVELPGEHTHTDAEWTDVHAPTYHFGGVRVKRCSICGEAYEYEYVPKLEREEGNDNVALGKKYTRSDLITSDGLEKYPDEDGTTMTDSFLASETGIYSDPAYIGFHKNYGDYNTMGYFNITVDLEEAYYLDEFVTYTASKYASAGVTGPKSVSVYVSEDGLAWFKAGETQAVDTDETSMLKITVTSENPVYGRYVQFRYVASNAFVMVAEVEAYETEGDSHEHTPGEWIEAQKPTVYVEGKNCKLCTVCGKIVETETLPKLELSVYGENLVLGKSYERSNLYASGGKDKYPDAGGKSMPDGEVGRANAAYANKEFMAFYSRNADYQEAGYFHITFDLGSEQELWRFVTYYITSSAHNKGAGVQEPATVDVYVSTDGNKWTSVGHDEPEELSDRGLASTEFILESAVKARYVQFRYTHKNTFVMVSEAEVYGFAVESEFAFGDVNGDGRVNTADYVVLKRHIMGSYKLSDDALARANINGDAKLNTADYVLLKRYIMGSWNP